MLDREVSVSIDMTAPTTGTIEVFINSETNLQRRTTPALTGRRTYRLSGFLPPLRSLRIDVLDAAGVNVVVHKVEMALDDKVVAEYRPHEIADWLQADLAATRIRGDGFEMETASGEGRIWTALEEDVRSALPGPILWLRRILHDPERSLALMIGVGSAILAVAWLIRRPLGVIPVFAGVLALAITALLYPSPSGNTSAAAAFGRAGWIGIRPRDTPRRCSSSRWRLQSAVRSLACFVRDVNICQSST